MLISLYIGAIVLGIILYKDKIAVLCIGLVMWLIFAFNTDNPDRYTYELIFEGYFSDTVEFGFLSLNNFVADIGAPYQFFYGMLATFSLACFFLAWKKWDGRLDGYSLSLLMLYPFFSMITAVRWAVAMSFTVLAITSYIKSNQNTKDKAKYLIMLFLAGLFHYSMLIFVLIIWLRPTKSSRELIPKIALIAGGSASIFMTNLPAMIISRLIGSEKIMSWFSSRIGIGIIIVYFFHFLCFYVFYYAYKAYSKELRKKGGTDSTLELMLSANLYSFLISGLYTFNMEFFSRMYIVVYLVDIAYINHIKKRCCRAKRQRISLLQIVCALFIAIFTYQSNFERIILKILENNLLF